MIMMVYYFMGVKDIKIKRMILLIVKRNMEKYGENGLSVSGSV